MYPTVDLTGLNNLFEPPRTMPTRLSPNSLTAEDEKGLEQFFTGLRNFNRTKPSSRTASPASSSSTIALDDEEIGSIFMSEKFGAEESLTPTIVSIEAGLQRCPTTTNDSPRTLLEQIHERALEAHRKANPPKPISQLSNELNPQALPFFPTSTPELTPAIAALHQIPSPIPFHDQIICHTPASFPNQPKWFPAFWQGARASAAAQYFTHAYTLVSSRSWDLESLAELAQHFCWKGAEDTSVERSGVAPFAVVVYQQLFNLQGEETAQNFVWHLRECVVGTFKAFWSADHPQAITYHNAPSFSYISSALALTAFIGDLFAHDLLPAPPTIGCLSLLLTELASIEHVQAIHALLLHATAQLWYAHSGAPSGAEDPAAVGESTNRAIGEFVDVFVDRAGAVQGRGAEVGASVLGITLAEGEVGQWVREVVDLVCGWRTESGCSSGQSIESCETTTGGSEERILEVGLTMARRC